MRARVGRRGTGLNARGGVPPVIGSDGARGERAEGPTGPPARSVRGQKRGAAGNGLRYVHDSQPGIRRQRRGRGFTYLAADGSRLTDEAELRRIRTLAIPPAWTDVWICTSPRGHIQATGRDARGRKQHRYHQRWHEMRGVNKFDRMAAFGETLPAIRARVDELLGRPGLPREKVVAAAVRLLDLTSIRVGNDEYARTNESYGLTTLQDDHAEIHGKHVSLNFRGKSGKEHEIGVDDQRLARIMQRCQDLEGQTLFQYVGGDGEPQAINSSDVNRFLRETAGQDFTAKDFRTWNGTVRCAAALRDSEEAGSERERKRRVNTAVRSASELLGNTATICRKSYIHPAVISAYTKGDLPPAQGAGTEERPGLSDDEAYTLQFLEPHDGAGVARTAS